MNWTLLLIFLAAQFLAGWACFKWGRSTAPKWTAPASTIPHPERTDGKLERATPEQIEALFGPRPVSR